jgi:hypothetical protein
MNTNCWIICNFFVLRRFVTWDVDGKGGSGGIYKSLPTPKKMAEIYTIAVDTRSKKTLEQEQAVRRKQQKSMQQTLVGTQANNRRVGAGQTIARAVPQKVVEDWQAATTGLSTPDAGAHASTTVVDPSLSLTSTSTHQLTTSVPYQQEDAVLADNYQLLQVMEEMLAGRDERRTSTIVTAVAEFIIRFVKLVS